jgi:hypothetical protein
LEYFYIYLIFNELNFFVFDGLLNGRQIFKTKKAVFICKKGYI